MNVRLAAVLAYEELWGLNVHDVHGDPPTTRNNGIITSLFDQNGWARWLRSMEPGCGNCPDGYQRPPDPDYCGHGAAHGFRRLGDHLEAGRCVDVMLAPEILERMLPSTRRLANLGSTTWRRLGFPDPHVDGPIERGDVVVVVTSARKVFGDHITVALGPERDGWFVTLEANASGTRADGSRGRGIIKTRRRVADVRQRIRFTEEHCIGL